MNTCHHAVGNMVKFILAPWGGQLNIVIYVHLHHIVEILSELSSWGISANYLLTSVNFTNFCGSNDTTDVSTYFSATSRPVLDTVQK